MPRLIDADALIEVIDNELFSTKSRKCYEKMRVRKQPTIDAEPVRHGRWIELKTYDEDGYYVFEYKCSECKYIEPFGVSNYCPNCGAKMDLEEGENGT